MSKFKASVQYNDLEGSVAADEADMDKASKWLKNKGKITDDEYLIGISMYAGENHGVHTDPVHVTFIISDLKGYDNIPEMLSAEDEPIPVKKIEEQMKLHDFFALFKRFEVNLSRKGLLEGKEID
jgi:hypothetical protein